MHFVSRASAAGAPALTIFNTNRLLFLVKLCKM
jgi:hypothetical protein